MIDALKLPVPLDAEHPGLVLRRADGDDLEGIMALLADDAVSASRGDRADRSDVDSYAAALTAILADPSNELVVAADGTDELVAMLQLTRIPGLSRRGSTRLLVEAVRVRSADRSSGIGTALLRWVLREATTATGAQLVQLTSDETREDAHRFYERLGFTGSHRGFKNAVPPADA